MLKCVQFKTENSDLLFVAMPWVGRREPVCKAIFYEENDIGI